MSIEVVECVVGTGVTPPTVTAAAPGSTLVYLYMRTDAIAVGYPALSMVTGLGATWQVNPAATYAYYAVAIGTNPTALSGQVMGTIAPVDPDPANATVVVWVLTGVTNPVKVKVDYDIPFAGEYELGFPTLAAAPGQAILATVRRNVWDRDLSFPKPDFSMPEAESWTVHPSAPGVAWMDDTSGFEPEGTPVRIDADWTPQPGDESQMLGGQTRYKTSATILVVGEADPVPSDGRLEWPEPTWVEPFVDRPYTSLGTAQVWADESRNKAIVAWAHESWDDNWDVDEAAIRACVVDVSTGTAEVGPVLTMLLPVGWEMWNYSTDLATIGDGYFVAGSSSWFDSPAGSASDEWKHRAHLFKIAPDGMSLVHVSTAELPSSVPRIGLHPMFAQTKNPDRVLAAAARYPSSGSAGRGTYMWTVTRSGDALTVSAGQNVADAGGGEEMLWVDKSRSIGYVGPDDQSVGDNRPGAIFTLDADGDYTITATGTFDRIPSDMAHNRWSSGPGDGQFTGSWNGVDLNYGGTIFDMVTVQVTPTGMEIVRRWGPYHGDEGWMSNPDRWIPTTITPDGKIAMLPSAYWNVHGHQRPYLVIDPQGEAEVRSVFMPTEGGWAAFAENTAYFGMSIGANDDGALVTVTAEWWLDEDLDNAGNPAIAAAFIPVSAEPSGPPLVTYPATSAVIPGPKGDEPWAAPHHGRYRIPDFGERKGYISFGAKMSADGPYYATVHARWSRWDGEGFDEIAEESLGFGPAIIGDEGGEFGYEASIFFDMLAHPDATHWQPVVRWYLRRPGQSGVEDSGIPYGGRARIDNIYIPDNGFPIASRPYLDGDQPMARWEGPRAASTSVYGEKPEVIRGRLVTLEPELLIPDHEGDEVDLTSLTYLDDDLTI